MTGTDRNPIDAALASFLESPVMIIVGSCDGGLLPQIARAAGSVVDRARRSSRPHRLGLAMAADHRQCQAATGNSLSPSRGLPTMSRTSSKVAPRAFQLLPPIERARSTTSRR